MNANEVAAWWDDYQTKYPSAGKWASGMEEPQWREIYAAWATVLTPVKLADALEVNRLMRLGAIEEVGTADCHRERIGHCVYSEARALAVVRNPPRPDDWEHDRVKCRDCRDSGFVEVYRPKFLGFLVRLLNSGESVTTARQRGWRGRVEQVVICHCEAGGEKLCPQDAKDAPRQLRTRARDSQRYAADRFWRIRHAAPTDIDRTREPAELVEEIQLRTFEQWLQAAEWFRDVLAGIQGTRTYDEFEQWNARADTGEVFQPSVEFHKP